MDTMIEKVARAICEADCGRVTENELARCIGLARAAIEAMREPTEAMVNAAITYGDSPILLTYEAMIDAALGEPANPADPGIPIYATTEGPKETFQGKRKG